MVVFLGMRNGAHGRPQKTSPIHIIDSQQKTRILSLGTIQYNSEVPYMNRGAEEITQPFITTKRRQITPRVRNF